MGKHAWLLLFAIVLLTASEAPVTSQSDSVWVNPDIHHQTILGWGKTTPWAPVHPLLREQCIDRAVNDLGLNRLRFEGLCGNKVKFQSWDWLNDNTDPMLINWDGFNTEALDSRA